MMHKRNDQLTKEQRKSLNRHVREIIDSKFEETVQQLTKEQQTSLNRKAHDTIDTYFRAKVRRQADSERQIQNILLSLKS